MAVIPELGLGLFLSFAGWKSAGCHSLLLPPSHVLHGRGAGVHLGVMSYFPGVPLFYEELQVHGFCWGRGRYHGG